MGRPTDVLTHFRVRRKLGAYLDGAVRDGDAGWIERHLTGCNACQHEVGALRRLKGLVAAAAAVPDPDWSGFFPGIVRGIEDGRRRTAAAAVPRRAWRVWPRWAMGGVAVAAAVFSLVLWQGARGPLPAEAGVVISDANTEHPGATVMVYAPPERDLAVVWVFDSD